MSNALFDRLFSVVQAAPACGNGDAAAAALRLGRELVSIHDGNGRSIDPIKLSTLMTKWNMRNAQPIGEQDLRKIVSAAYRQPDQPAAGRGGPRVQAVVELAADIPVRPINWLWQDRLEQGALNLLAADPGSGKSLLSADLAARVTRGIPWPDETHAMHRKPGSVVIVASEDDPSRSTVPRLIAAGADLQRVAIVRGVVDGRNRRQVCLQRDIAAIEAAIIELGEVQLVCIDPVDSYIGRGDSNANEEMRQVLEPVVALAERQDVAVLAIKHLNKAVSQPSALYRIAGSMAFVALPRTVSIIGTDQDDRELRLLVGVKVSHGRRPDPLGYRVRANDDGQPVIRWEPVANDADPDALLQGRTGRQQGKGQEAADWLVGLLTDHGPMLAAELQAAAEAAGINRRNLEVAKDKLRKAGRTVSRQVRDDQKHLVGWTLELREGAQ
jgi:hypothetical protein